VAVLQGGITQQVTPGHFLTGLFFSGRWFDLVCVVQGGVPPAGAAHMPPVNSVYGYLRWAGQQGCHCSTYKKVQQRQQRGYTERVVALLQGGITQQVSLT
jgi:hypothetical protein